MSISINVEKNELVIRYPIKELSEAFNISEYASPYDEQKEDWIPKYKAVPIKSFAKSICLALKEEDEKGTTSVHILFDEAFENVLESGKSGIKELEETK